MLEKTLDHEDGEHDIQKDKEEKDSKATSNHGNKNAKKKQNKRTQNRRTKDETERNNKNTRITPGNEKHRAEKKMEKIDKRRKHVLEAANDNTTSC